MGVTSCIFTPTGVLCVGTFYSGLAEMGSE